jgi:hypothetical protein
MSSSTPTLAKAWLRDAVVEAEREGIVGGTGDADRPDISQRVGVDRGEVQIEATIGRNSFRERGEARTKAVLVAQITVRASASCCKERGRLLS